MLVSHPPEGRGGEGRGWFSRADAKYVRISYNRPFQCTIRSHGTKSQMLGCTLYSGTSKIKAPGGLHGMKRTCINGVFILLIFFIEPGLILFARLE